MADPVPYGLTDEVLAAAQRACEANFRFDDYPAMRAVLVPAIEQATKRVRAEDLLRLRAYVVAQGPIHDDDCPGDDTCECSWKPTLDVVNALCRLADSTGACPGATYRHKHYLGTGLANGRIRCPDLYGEKDAEFNPAFWVED